MSNTKINLRHKRPMKVAPKRKLTPQMQQTQRPRIQNYPPQNLRQDIVYMIATRQNQMVYYVKKVDQDNGAIHWTPERTKAMMFHTENGTQHFIHAYLKDREDIALVETTSIHA